MRVLTEDNLPQPEEGPFAASDMLPLVYDDLRRLAAEKIASEGPGHTLQPTALVHESYLRLLSAGVHWNGPRHFFRAAADAMRRVLVDAARQKASLKRGGEHKRANLDPDDLAAPGREDELIDLHEALTRFATIEPEIAELVTLRYFGGLSLKDAAEVMNVAPRTADGYWAYARTWLLAELDRG